MTHAAPLARLALAYGVGVVVGSLGAPIWSAPLVGILGATLPIFSSERPVRMALSLALLAGWLAVTAGPAACAPHEGPVAEIRGHFLATPRSGSAPFAVEGGCGTFTVVVSVDSALPPAGRSLVIEGTWVDGQYRPWLRAVSFSEVEAAGGPTATLARQAVRWRDDLVGRLPRLYGERAPLVSALVFARREGLDREVRDSFALVGIAHLLAISGFHVGIIAGAALALLRVVG
ncbi:MAG: hypothetical protein HKO77_04620, partial [Gemmatimonadetes bacterium]|nr:hypothetical protein [Gemmatimonadota bacterium]